MRLASGLLVSAIFLILTQGAHVCAQTPPGSPDSADMQLFYEKDELITIATRQPTPVSKVPAVATVITDHQIRDMGARTLFEALKVVPGLGIFQDYSHDRGIEIRGIKTLNSEKIMVLQDGVRLNTFVYGGAFPMHSNLPLDNVKRIEILRGPASALYGANAFVGVINVVTREGGDVNGIEMRAGGGSFGTQRYGVVGGRKLGDLQVAAHFNYLESDGDRLRIEQDFIGASGKTSNGRQYLGTGLSVAWRDLRLDYRHAALQLEPYIGAATALNEESHNHFVEDSAQLTFRRTLFDGLNISAQVYWSLHRTDAFWELFPDGFGGGAFPDGVLGNPRVKNRTYGADIQADYRLFEGNLLTVGVNVDRIKQYDVQHWANFNPTTGAPLAGGFQSITDTLNWNKNAHRNVFAWYVQDSWNITDRLNFIVGVRHDQYSDFGNTTNPRAGLVWEFLKDTHLKLLVGRAFRAPTSEELYNTNNPSVTGNPGLDPERITTTEISVETKAGTSSVLKLAYFKNYLNDTIRLQPMAGGGFRYANTARNRIAGIEAEARYYLNRTDNVYTNISWMEPKRLGSGGEITDIPKWRSNIGGNLAFARFFNLNANMFISGDRPRAAGDWRKDIPSYAVLDAALTMKNFWKGLELQLVAKNLLDKRYDDPAPASTVPGDYPRDGREIFLEARYTF